MENASKALIIAGAILLAILIISLGIMIYRNAAGVAKGDQMSQFEIQSYNERFEQYCGTQVRGANVNALINAVNTHNNTEEDESRQISLQGVTENAATGKTYNVEVTDHTTSGLISEITITEN